MHQTIPHTLRMWISSGNGGPGGTVWKRRSRSRCAAASAGTRGRRRAARAVLDRPERRPADHVRDRMSAERELGHDAEVAAAAAQRPEQVGVLVGARGHSWPSASTTSAASRLSIVSPYARSGARSAAEGQSPDAGRRDDPHGTASPCTCVAASTSAHVAPPPTRTVRASGSTGLDAARGRRRSRRRRCRGRRRCGRRRESRAARRASRAKAITRDVVGFSHRAIRAGRLSIMALNRARASS